MSKRIASGEDARIDALPDELTARVRSFSDAPNRIKMYGVNRRGSETFLADTQHAYETNLRTHPEKHWSALVHSLGQLKADDRVSDRFLSIVAQGPCDDLRYLKTLATNNVHPVHVVHFLLTSSHGDGISKALDVARVVHTNKADFECAIPCMNKAAQDKINFCTGYAKKIDNFVNQVCRIHAKRYEDRVVHHIERHTSFAHMWCYNTKTAWVVSSQSPDVPANPVVLPGVNNTVSVQRGTNVLYYHSYPYGSLTSLEVEPSGVRHSRNFVAVTEETVKTISVTQGSTAWLVQLRRSGNIVFYNQSDEEEPAILGQDTGPYVDILELARGDVADVQLIALSSKGKVYCVTLTFLLDSLKLFKYQFAQLEFTDDVPVVQIVGVSVVDNFFGYRLVTRNAEDTLRVHYFDRDNPFKTNLRVQCKNITMIPKTLFFHNKHERYSVEKSIVAIRPDRSTQVKKLCRVTEKYEVGRTPGVTLFLTSEIVELRPENPTPTFIIENIVEMVQANRPYFFCLMASGDVYLCKIDNKKDTYTVQRVALGLPTQSGAAGAVMDGSAFVVRLRV